MASPWAASVQRCAALAHLLCVAWSLGACTLDTRTLASAEGGSTSGGTSSVTAGTGSRAGAGGMPVVDIPVCTYPTTEPGCDSMIDNAGFADTIEPWAEEPLAITARWSKDDADGSKDSGSIIVINTMHGTTNGFAPGGAMLCLEASPGEVFGMAADVFIPKDQGDGLPADEEMDLLGPPFVSQAGLGLLFWPTPDCSSSAATQGSFQTNLVEEAGKWQHVEGSAVAPSSAGSVSVRALTIKPFRQFAFEAHFDNVLVQRK